MNLSRLKQVLKTVRAVNGVHSTVTGIAKLFGREELFMPKKPWWKSHIEFGLHFIEEHTFDGMRPAFRAGVLWLYDPARGVWDPVIKDTLETYLMKRYHGRKVGGGHREEVVLSDQSITTVAKHIMRASAPERLTQMELTPFGTHHGITFRNGFLRINADGAALEPISPKQKSTFYLDLDWDPAHKNGWFTSVLGKIWGHDADGAQKIDTFYEFAGMSLLGLAPTMKRALILFGERGDNGKSTLIECLRRAFGGGTAGGFVRAIPPKDFSSATAIAPLAWARLNAVPELGTEEFPSPEAVKAVISGDTMAGRYLYQSGFDFIPMAGHLYGCNGLPTARDPSDAFWKRWIVLECARVIPKEEMDPKGELPRLMDSAQLEVLQGAVAGATRLLRRGRFDPPEASVRQLETWRRRSDQLAQFLRVAAVPVAELDPTPLDELYRKYTSWSHLSGHRRMSQSSFEERVKSAAVSAGVKGFMLKEDQPS